MNHRTLPGLPGDLKVTMTFPAARDRAAAGSWWLIIRSPGSGRSTLYRALDVEQTSTAT
jgi:hypothetical protein